jgi:hypothetical protein
MSGIDNRRATRIPVVLPVNLDPTGSAGGNLIAKTKDFSSNGVSFEFSSPIDIGSELIFILILPEQITHGKAVRIKCKGKVVRVFRAHPDSDPVSVAATIDRYEEFKAVP